MFNVNFSRNAEKFLDKAKFVIRKRPVDEIGEIENQWFDQEKVFKEDL